MIIKIDERIHELMDTYSNEIENNDYSFFFEDLKTSILELAEEYISETYNNNYGLILDIENQLSFSDAKCGYKAQMKKFIEDNQIVLVAKDISVDDINVSIDIPKKAIYAATGGTIVAVALCFAANVWIGLLAEIIALGYAYKVYNDTRKYALAIQMQQIMNEKKEVFINQIIADISDWYNKLSSKSDDILRTFNLSI